MSVVEKMTFSTPDGNVPVFVEQLLGKISNLSPVDPSVEFFEELAERYTPDIAEMGEEATTRYLQEQVFTDDEGYPRFLFLEDNPNSIIYRNLDGYICLDHKGDVMRIVREVMGARATKVGGLIARARARAERKKK